MSTYHAIELARKAWPHLVAKAAAGDEPFTYTEIGNMVGVGCRSCGPFLGVIQSHCLKQGMPRLQALVVENQTGLPSKPTEDGRGYNGSRKRSDHAEELRKVRSFNWPSIPPFDAA
ncbi:hypothetical protein N9D37_00990 [Erythrobacter sp.]|nr:hypothetical protein [Erythrobacter sp.]